MEPPNDEQRSIIDQWLAALHDPDWNTRATAVRMLGELGKLTPLEPLLNALNDEDESVRAATVRALGKLGERTPVNRLVVTLSDSSWMVREMAALTLGELGEQAPTEPLLDILRTEHEDVFVREAAKISLQQTHPEVLPSLVKQEIGTNHYPDRTNERHPIKSSSVWLTSFANQFSHNHTTMQQEDDLVEISDLDTTAHSSQSSPPPVSVNSGRHLSLRIAEGVLAALLIVGIGFSWLVLTQKLHRPTHTGATPTSTPSPTLLPSGQGYNVSLAVVNGVVAVGTMDNVVYALRASDGSLLWRYNTAGPVDGPVGSPPVVVDGIVYVNAYVDQGLLGYGTGYIYALRASDGTLLWRYTTGNFVYHGYVYSPTVTNGVVYVASQAGSLTALRASDGALLWRYTAKGQVAVSLVVNGIVYLLDTNIDQGPDYLEALRANDGKLLWRTPSYDYLPVIVNNVLYITSQTGLAALRARDGTLLWRYTLANTGFAGPTVVDGVVYAVAFKYSLDTSATTPTAGYAREATITSNGKMLFKIPFKQQGGPSSLYALRASNGTALWHYQTPGDKNNGMGVLAVAGGLVYMDTTTGQSKEIISALRASDGSVLWTRVSDALSDWAVVNQGVIYIASNSDVVSALRANDGEEFWHYNVEGNVYSSPVLDGSTLYVGTDNGVVYALNAQSGSLRWHYVIYASS